MRRNLLLMSCLAAAFLGGVAFADAAAARRHATQVVASTNLLPYTIDALETLVAHWQREGMVTADEAFWARQALKTGDMKDSVRDLCIAALVDEFDEATLRRVAVFFGTPEGRRWAQNYEDTMQGMTEKAGLALLLAIQQRR